MSISAACLINNHCHSKNMSSKLNAKCFIHYTGDARNARMVFQNRWLHLDIVKLQSIGIVLKYTYLSKLLLVKWGDIYDYIKYLVANPLQSMTVWNPWSIDNKHLACSLVMLCQSCTAAIFIPCLCWGLFCFQSGLQQVKQMLSWIKVRWLTWTVKNIS